MDKNLLVCQKVTYYSQKDEDAFFEWIKKIDCIDRFFGVGDKLYLEIAADKIHDYDLIDLLALFYRYNIDMRQLKRFLTVDNKKWFFDNKIAYWHERVFGVKKLKK